MVLLLAHVVKINKVVEEERHGDHPEVVACRNLESVNAISRYGSMHEMPLADPDLVLCDPLLLMIPGVAIVTEDDCVFVDIVRGVAVDVVNREGSVPKFV